MRYLGGGAAGGFEQQQTVLGGAEVEVEVVALDHAEVVFGGLLEGEHDGVVEVAILAAFEAFDGTEDVLDREAAGGVFADEGAGAKLEGFHDDAPDVVNSLQAAPGRGDCSILSRPLFGGVVKPAGEDDYLHVGVALVYAAGDHETAGGFALELHVDKEVVGRRNGFEGGEERRAVGEGVDHLDRSHLAAVDIAATRGGGYLDGDVAAVHLHLDDFAYQRLVVDHHDSDIHCLRVKG